MFILFCYGDITSQDIVLFHFVQPSTSDPFLSSYLTVITTYTFLSHLDLSLSILPLVDP